MSHVTADLPCRHRRSVSDYYRMVEFGVIAPDAWVELIEGEIFDMRPPARPSPGGRSKGSPLI